MNLCINALDAMPYGGNLSISVQTIRGAVAVGVAGCVDRGTTTAVSGTMPANFIGENWVELEVVDTGCGMSPEILKRAMDPFFTTKPVGKGTGLGLSMAYGVAKAHGGTMTITSAPGAGTTVKLCLPGIPAPYAEQNIEAVDVAVVLASVPKDVLLVDDDEDVLYLVSWMLTDAGYTVRTAARGEEALVCVNTSPLPDIIILDQNMPGMTGVRAMERIHAIHPDLPILISSGQPEIQEWPVFGQHKSGFIPKPFNLAELEAAMVRLAGK